ncbi:MAG: DUF4405 domain-containing protein [Bacteroidales bacterium]
MKKTNQCLLIDILMFIFLALMTGLGLLIKYILVPGSKRWEVYDRNVDLTFLGLDRHGWGTVHLIIALLFITLLVLHIILHWRCLINYLCKAGVKKVMIIPLLSVSAFILLMLIMFPFIVDIKVTELGDGRDRFIHDNVYNNVPSADRDRQIILKERTGKGSESDYDRPGENMYETEHHDIDPDIEVLGSMSLINVSMKYNVPVSHIIKELDLPYSVSGNEQLGRLRRLYGFKMSDIELIIHKYRHK